MSEHTVRARVFGDPVVMTVRVDRAGIVVEVTPEAGNERCRELVRSVNRALAAGKALVHQHHTLIQVGDILSALLDLQDAQVAEARTGAKGNAA